MVIKVNSISEGLEEKNERHERRSCFFSSRNCGSVKLNKHDRIANLTPIKETEKGTIVYELAAHYLYNTWCTVYDIDLVGIASITH